MSRYRQTMSELLEQVRQQDFTEGHSDKDFKPYPDWKKTTGGRYPRFKHSQKGEIQVDRYGEWLHSDKSGKTVAFFSTAYPKNSINSKGATSMKLTDYLKRINENEEVYENASMGYIVKFANRKGEKIAQAWYKDEKSAKEALEAIKKNGGNGIITKGKMNEEGDHEVSMARGELEAIADKASQLAGALQGKSDEGNPLEAWVQSKITKAKDYINSVSDYLMYNPDMKQNEELEEGDAYDNNRYMMKKYMGQILARPDNSNTKDGKDHVYAPNAQIAKQLYKQGKKVYREELEEAKIISDISGVGINVIKKEVMPFNVKVGKVGPGMDSDYEVEFIGSEPNLIKYAKKHLDFDGNSFSQLKKHLAMEETEVNEKTYGWTLVSKAKDLAKKFANNMTKAVAEIEKLEKGLSKNPTVDAELRKYNESIEEKFTVQVTKKDGTTMELGRYNTAAEAQRYVDMYDKGAKVKKEESDLEEASLKDIFTANQEGKKADEIAKKLGMSVSDIKKILGEEMGEVSEENLDEFTSDMIKRLKKSYSTMPQKLSTDQANALSRHLDRLDLVSLKQLAKEKIPFITTLARNKIYKKTGKFEDVNEQDGKIGPAGKIALAKEKDTDALEKQLTAATGQINVLKQKLENEKNTTIKPIPNPETGEVPLTIGIANKLLKDKAEKEAKKKEVKEERRLYVEAIAGLQKKADKSGMPYSILKKVYDRGMAAWKGGHRPGASQHQWAFARVNSFVTKSSGTWGGADKDLAKQVKG